MSNQEPATILLIDDHPMLRTGVKQLISMAPDITVVGEASNGEQGIELAESLDPDLILLDLNMPGMNGLETLDKLREKSLSGRIVVFSVSNHEEDVVTALKRGADGYLLKDMEPEDLLKALHQAAAGEMVLSEALTPVLAASLRANRATTERDVNQLTPRERDILADCPWFAEQDDCPPPDITEHSKSARQGAEEMKLKPRVEAAVWVHQSAFLITVPSAVRRLTMHRTVRQALATIEETRCPTYFPPPQTIASDCLPSRSASQA